MNERDSREAGLAIWIATSRRDWHDHEEQEGKEFLNH